MALFRRFEYTTYAEVIAALHLVRFPTALHTTAVDLTQPRGQVRRNAEILLDHIHASLKYGVLLTDEDRALLEVLRLDCYAVLRYLRRLPEAK